MPDPRPIVTDLQTLEEFVQPRPLPILDLFERYRTFPIVFSFGSASTLQWDCVRDCYIVAVTVLSGSGQFRMGLTNPVPVIPGGAVTDRFDILDFNVLTHQSGLCFAVKAGYRMFCTSTGTLTFALQRIFPGPAIPED